MHGPLNVKLTLMLSSHFVFNMRKELTVCESEVET